MSGNSRKAGRRPLTKHDLLPLPPAKVREISLENHLAFAVVNAGAGGGDQMSCLLRVVYLAYYLRDETISGSDNELYRQGAEQALNACIERAAQSHHWALLDNEQALLAQVLSLHDEQLAAVPAYRYVRAWERMQAFLKAERVSPITD